MAKRTWAEALDMTPEDLGEFLGVAPEGRDALASQQVYPEQLADPFEAGVLVGFLGGRYDLQGGHLIGALQWCAGTTWVRRYAALEEQRTK